MLAKAPRTIGNLVTKASDIIIQKIGSLASHIESELPIRYLIIDHGTHALRCGERNGTSTRYPFEALPDLDAPNNKVTRTISESSHLRLSQIMGLVKQQIQASAATHICAISTDALRSASNAKSIIRAIYEETGILLQPISGEVEGYLIYRAVQDVVKGKSSYFVVDMGGGSLEVLVIKQGELVVTCSKPLGAKRLQKIKAKQVIDCVSKAFSTNLPGEIDRVFKGQAKPSVCYLTGGTSGDIMKLLNKSKQKPISIKRFRSCVASIQKYTTQELKDFGLSNKRIVGIKKASQALLAVMEALKTKEIRDPQTGLRAGLVLELESRKKDYSASKLLTQELLVFSKAFSLDPHDATRVATEMQSKLGSLLKYTRAEFRVALVVTAVSTLYNIGRSLASNSVNGDNYDTLGAEYIWQKKIYSLSSEENNVVAWLIKNQNIVRPERAAVSLQLSQKETNILEKLHTALRTADRARRTPAKAL